MTALRLLPMPEPGTAPVSLGPTQFAAVYEMAQLGLRMANRLGQRRFREIVATLRDSFLADSNPLAPDEHVGISDLERRRRAAVLTDLLWEFDRGSEATQLQLRSERLGPTPEMHRRTAGSPITRLVETGRLDFVQLRAANEIRLTVEDRFIGACTAIARYGERIDTSRPATYAPSRTIELGERVAAYSAWYGVGLNLGWPLEALLNVIAFGHAIREAERAARIANGTLPDKIDEALTRYVVIAGWSRP